MASSSSNVFGICRSMCIACVNIYVYCVCKDLCALCLGFLSERTIKDIIIMCQDSLSQTCRKKRKKYIHIRAHTRSLSLTHHHQDQAPALSIHRDTADQAVARRQTFSKVLSVVNLQGIYARALTFRKLHCSMPRATGALHTPQPLAASLVTPVTGAS